jgi:hypothetical protein
LLDLQSSKKWPYPIRKALGMNRFLTLFLFNGIILVFRVITVSLPVSTSNATWKS